MSKKPITNNFFKHANDASYGCSIQLLFEKKAYRAVCLYWFILERLSAQNNGDTLTISSRHVATQLGTDCRGVANDLRTCSEQVGSFSFELVGNFARITIDNFSYLQGKPEKTRQDKTIQDKIRLPEKVDQFDQSVKKPIKNGVKKDVLAAPFLSPSVTPGDPINGLSPIDKDQCIYLATANHGFSVEFINKCYDEYLIWAQEKNQVISPARFLGWLKSDITKAKWKKIEKEYKDRQKVRAILAELEKDCPSQILTSEEARKDPADVTIKL